MVSEKGAQQLEAADFAEMAAAAHRAAERAAEPMIAAAWRRLASRALSLQAEARRRAL